MVLALAGLRWIYHNLRSISNQMETVSIIIPSLNRPESLATCLGSIENQTYKDYRIYVISDDAPLSVCRNKGAKLARGKYLVFIDDDVRCTPRWLEEIVSTFERFPAVGGVSGLAVISEEFRSRRDLFRYKHIKRWLYDKFFCDGQDMLPSHITASGTFTTGASNENCNYEGEVDFLEACNMAFRADIFNDLGGFDNVYEGVGEWCEPDLSFAIRKIGWKLWFNPRAKLYHEPSRTGVFHKRNNEISQRIKNYETFAKRWVSPCLKHSLFKLFVRFYYAIKALK